MGSAAARGDSGTRAAGLALQDLLRLAGLDRRFAHALLADPTPFAGPFSLDSGKLDVLRRAPTLEEALRVLHSEPTPPGDDSAMDQTPTTPMSLSDALRLADLDEKFASLLLHDPDAFKTPFGLADAEVEKIRNAASLEELGSRTQ